MFMPASDACKHVNQWARVKCKCTCTSLRTYQPGHDSFADVVKGHSLLNVVKEGHDIVDAWCVEPNCIRLSAFVQYATKQYSTLSSATHCGIRRLFIIVAAKVSEFYKVFQSLQAANWDWTVVNQYKPWCPGGPGHDTHCVQLMAQHMTTLAKLYASRTTHEEHVLTRLEQHMCHDLASHVLLFYSNKHVI